MQRQGTNYFTHNKNYVIIWIDIMSNKIRMQSKINPIIIIINKILIIIFFESSWFYGFDEDHQTNIEIIAINVSQNRNTDFFRLQDD